VPSDVGITPDSLLLDKSTSLEVLQLSKKGGDRPTKAVGAKVEILQSFEFAERVRDWPSYFGHFCSLWGFATFQRMLIFC